MAEMNNATIAQVETIDAAVGAKILEKYEKESRTRNFTDSVMTKLVYALCLFFTVSFGLCIRHSPLADGKHKASRYPCRPGIGIGICSLSRI